MELWARRGYVVALVVLAAPVGLGREGHALAAVVMCRAAGWDLHACLSIFAPGVSFLANTISSLAVVILGERTVHWQIVAGVGLRAESGADFEVDADSAVVVGVAASRDGYA